MGHLTCKIVSKMTYKVSSGTLNLYSLTHYLSRFISNINDFSEMNPKQIDRTAAAQAGSKFELHSLDGVAPINDCKYKQYADRWTTDRLTHELIACISVVEQRQTQYLTHTTI